MRRALAAVALAVTSMIALSFSIPLALLVQSEARSRAITQAEQKAAALSPVLAITTEPGEVEQAVASLDGDKRLGVHLPSGSRVGPSTAPPSSLKRAAQRRESFSLETDQGWVYLQPVVLPENEVAVVEAFVPAADLNRGVEKSWIVLALLALGLVTGSVAVADRLGTRVVRASKDLSRAAHAFRKGDLRTRVAPGGPPELLEAGTAFNAMADHVVDLLAMERELVADLSHRLRTPLTALHLEAERLAKVLPESEGRRLEGAVTFVDSELSSIIKAARVPLVAEAASPGGQGCEAATITAARADFWSILAHEQGRRHTVEITDEPTAVMISEDDFAAVVDALVGNIFRHTPQGTPFAITVHRTAHSVVLTVDDGGAGIEDPESALTRGLSGQGSTGLGLDIAQRAATTCQGSLRIGRSPLGGARVSVEMRLGPVDHTVRRGARRMRHGHGQTSWTGQVVQRATALRWPFAAAARSAIGLRRSRGRKEPGG
ncbi:ATP-binding protein [Streptomyces sp. NPDC003456]|uniref:HAMP domain-containing sensor histidine kinase n=1 Tax=Streptomyces sp. NPDC003456 TaxID=3364683 RepID=UPI0036CA7BAD